MWLTVSKDAKRSKRIRTDNSLTNLASCGFRVLAKRAVSVKCTALNQTGWDLGGCPVKGRGAVNGRQ